MRAAKYVSAGHEVRAVKYVSAEAPVRAGLAVSIACQVRAVTTRVPCTLCIYKTLIKGRTTKMSLREEALKVIELSYTPADAADNLLSAGRPVVLYVLGIGVQAIQSK